MDTDTDRIGGLKVVLGNKLKSDFKQYLNDNDPMLKDKIKDEAGIEGDINEYLAESDNLTLVKTFLKRCHAKCMTSKKAEDVLYYGSLYSMCAVAVINGRNDDKIRVKFS
jgi:hypothetical protein